MLKLVGDDVPSIEQFMSRYRVSLRPIVRYSVKLTVLDGPSRRTPSIESRRACDNRAFQ